jgi:hypothetical protein
VRTPIRAGALRQSPLGAAALPRHAGVHTSSPVPPVTLTLALYTMLQFEDWGSFWLVFVPSQTHSIYLLILHISPYTIHYLHQQSSFGQQQWNRRQVNNLLQFLHAKLLSVLESLGRGTTEVLP